MGLSHDLISEFVKVTNNKVEPKNETVYGTVVQGSDGKYVKIDGSDILTPMDTTTDIEDGERVIITIKDHNATVNGNVSSPSASSNRVDDVVSMVDGISAELGVFEELVAEKVSVNELEAYKATVSELVAGKANIEDLEATYATIEDLVVKDAEIESLIANKAEIEDLKVVNAEIERLKVKDAEIEDAVIDNLEATKAEITLLDADLAQIKTLVSGNLTSDNISSFNVTADKVTVEDAFIKDAMIDTVNAAKINAGKINTSSVAIGSQDGGMLITGATQQFTDKNGNVRIQIGRDTSGDFTFALYGEDGQGQLINQNGITASAIADGLIINDMVSNDAAISGDKLDISSVITEINNDNSTTIKSNKIYLDEQNQSLEVAFNKLKTQVDTIKDVDVDGELTTITEKVQSNTAKIEANTSSINTLISEDSAIKKQVSDLEGNVVETTNSLNSKYTSLNQSLDGFKTTVANTYATKSSVNDVKNNLEGNYSTTSAMNSAINQKVDEISATISDTYATKGEMKTIDDNIKTNYSTTEQMESAISVAKDEINLGISKVYETKTNVESKISSSASSTLTNAKSYADTKKSEAISTASSDATSKANNALTSAKSYTDTAKNALNTEIGKKANSADVYTKSQTYTKSETDSAIKLSKDNIELGISEKYETISNVSSKITTAINGVEVGGRNLLRNSNKTVGETASREFVQFADLAPIIDKHGLIEYTVSFDIKSKNTSKNNQVQVYFQNGNSSKHTGLQQMIAVTTEFQRKSVTFTPRVGNTTETKSMLAFYGIYDTGNIPIVKNVKFEKGNKATDYTVAPEDIDSNISTAETNAVTTSKSYTDSQIKLSKDAIELGISQTYETKSNVSSQVSTTLTNAKSYADTKKSEAISTASSDATSKANNALTSAKSYTDTAKNALNTEIGKKANSADVYTKTQTYTKTEVDSAIKLSKDAIELGVSQKYETKEEVTNKVTTAVNNIQVGGRNLWNTNNLANGYESSGNVTSSATNHKITNYYIELNGARYVTVQLWNPNKLNNTANTNRIVFYDTNKTFISNAQTPKPTGSTYYIQTYTVPTNAVYFKVGMICGVSAYDESIKVKVELGNKPTDWTPAPEDIDTSIQNISSNLESFENTVNGTFKDGIIEQAEAKAIQQNINILNNEKADIDKEYTSIYNNTNLSGTAKTNLNSAYTSYTSAHTSLISTINTAISDGRTNATEKASVNSTFTTYKGVLATYKQRVQEALDYISSYKVDSVQVGSRNYFLNSLNFSMAPNNTGTGSSVKKTDESDIYYRATPSSGKTISLYKAISKSSSFKPNGIDKYIISLMVRSQKDATISIYDDAHGSNRNNISVKANTWTKISTIPYVMTRSQHLILLSSVVDSYLDYKMAKLELGDKSTDWSPSPEDVNTAITSAETNAVTTSKTYTDSQISITKEAIELGVKNTYETKTEVTNKINAIQVGGNNLVKDSRLLTSVSGSIGSGLWNVSDTGTDNQFKKLEINTTGTGWVEINIPVYAEINSLTSKLTISFEYYTTNENLLIFNFGAYNSSGGRLKEITNWTMGAFKTLYTYGDWKRVSLTFDPTSVNGVSGATNYRIQFKKNSGQTGQVGFRKPMLEVGTVASEWSPSNRDIQTSITSAITESKTYADSQIKIAKDSITQRVEQTETNISTITNTTNKLNTGLNKWLIELFERGNVTGTNAITVNNLLGKTPTKTFLRDDMNGYINIGDNYLARMTTNVYLDADYSWTTNARSDDGGTLYLNGVSILTTGTTAKSVTLNFKQGWNKITWVYNENTGGDGGYFDTKLSSLSQVRVMTAYDQTNISEDLNQLNNTTTTIKGTVDNISSKHGLAYAKDIVIYGESNKYYPVYVRGGNQDVLRTIKIWRAYSEQAPSDWYNSTHKGSLMTTWQGNFGGWGGAAYREYLLEHSSEYTQLLADCNRSVHSMAYTFFLRGGGETGAIYHFASDQALTLEVYYNGSSDLVYDNTNESYKIYAYAPKTTVNTERLKNLKIARESSVTTVSNKVATIETNLNGITSRVSSTETKLNNITVGGYNLIKKKSGYKLGYLSSSTGVETPSGTINSNQDFFTEDYFPIKNGQTVYFAAYPKEGITSTLISAVYIHVYDSSKTWTKSVSNVTSSKTKSIVSYTATADGYIRFSARGFTDYNHMAEYGTVPSAWSPNQDDIDSDNIGLNKWKREKYNVTLASNSTFPTMNDISGKTLQYSDEYDDSTNLISGITGDYFIAHIKTNVLVSADKTVTLTPSTTVDDTVTVYTNGVIDGRANGTEAINLRLKKGWNSISILFYEHAGGEVLTFDKKLSDHVDKMAYAVNSNSQDPTVSEIATRVSTAEQKITSDAIVSTVTSSKTYTDAMTGKVNKTEIISSINQTAESVKINAGKIELTGTVVANAINSGSTTINGSKITTGSITASQIASNVLSASTIVSTINNGSTTISGNKIRSGIIQSTNNALSFDLNGACIIVKDANGNKVGQTIRNTVSGTGVYGMSSAGDYNSYVGLSIKTSSTATTYSLGVTLLGQDGLISGYKKGVNFGLESWFWTTSNFQAASIFNATATFKSSLNYSTATGSYVYATRVYVDELRTRTSPNNSATDIKLYDSVHMNGWSVKMPVVEWDVFSRSSGDNIKFTKFSSSSESHLRLILADDTSTYFSIIGNHYEKGLQAISRFKYANGTVGGSADSVRFLMYGCMNLNNWGIINAGSIYGSSIKSLSLDVESDTITVQSSSPVVLSTGDDFRDIDIPTKTQYLTASTTNTLNHHGTVTVDDEVEYVELPSDFIMCMNIHVVATPNKLCRYAITSIDEYGFVIECDEKNVTFTYTVVADKIDIMSLTERKMNITPIESTEEEGTETPVQCKIDEEPTTKDTITHKEILVEAI